MWFEKYFFRFVLHTFSIFISAGIALDGSLREEDVNLASSTLIGEGKSPSEALGIVISYSIRVKVNCGTLGGELVTDVPFKLMHPAPGKFPSHSRLLPVAEHLNQTISFLHSSGTIERERVNAMKKMKSIERHRYENSHYADDDDNIVFEDFARLRMNEPE